MKCPVCGHEGLAVVTKDFPFTYKGESTVVKDVTSEHCPSCNEDILGGEEWKRVDEAMMEFVKGINARDADPQFIRDVRKKLNLDQQEAGRIFGGGVNAFSRYEKGKTVPPVAVVKLLRILDRHPELLSEIRQ